MVGPYIVYVVCGMFFAAVYLGIRGDALDEYDAESHKDKLLWRFPGLTSLGLVFGWLFVVLGFLAWLIWVYIRLLGREIASVLDVLRKE